MSASQFDIKCARSDVFMASLPDGCVNLAILDIPYFGVKDEDWDNAWPSAATFLAWVGAQADMWRRVLAPNGTLYVFASPQMAWGIEGVIRERFEVLSNIRWAKDAGWHEKQQKEALRSPFPASETILMADHGFEWVRAYLDKERRRAGITFEDVRAAVGCADGSGLPSHWFTRSQWMLPSRATYEILRALFCRNGGEFLTLDYDSLRRPFTVSATVPYTDVWTYPTVGAYPGKHPCEKPAQMGADIVAASSRPGDVVADFYCGSGIFLAEAVKAGRRALGCDMSEHWADVTRRRCEMAVATGQTRIRRIESEEPRQGKLF